MSGFFFLVFSITAFRFEGTQTGVFFSIFNGCVNCISSHVGMPSFKEFVINYVQGF